MRKNYCFRWTAFFVFVLTVFASCESKMDKYYELPDWMKGNAWQLLEEKGNYSIFLAGIEKAGYKDMVNGKGILTIMAPNDQAFTAYLASKGYSSINDMPLDELKLVVNYHLLYYSFDKGQLANYMPWGEEMAATPSAILLRGLCFKFRTKSQTAITMETDYAVGFTTPPVRKVYHKEYFLPVFSSYQFDNKGIDAKANYEYFYPNSTWTGSGGNFNVANASVNAYAIPTDNGYIYEISEVLRPVQTVDKELERNSDFSVFKSLYDKFVVYTADMEATTAYGETSVDTLWLRYHNNLPKIAAEWSYNGPVDMTGGIPDYANLPNLSALMVNIFAPSDNAMTTLWDNFFATDFTNWSDLSYVTVRHLLANHVIEPLNVQATLNSEMGVVYPENINNGNVRSMLGGLVRFNTDNVPENMRLMCANGTLYGLDEAMVPAPFTSITAPLFKYRRFNMSLHMAHQAAPSGVFLNALSTQGQNFKFYIPNDEMLTNTTTINGQALRFWVTNPNSYGGQAVQMEGSTDWASLGGFACEQILRYHVVTTDMTPNRTITEGKVYKTLLPYGYLWFKGDKIYSSNSFNTRNIDPAMVPGYNLVSGVTPDNGEVFELTGEDASALVPVQMTTSSGLRNLFVNENTCPEEYKEFCKLILGAGYGPTNLMDFLMGERFVMFIPSNAAVIAGKAAGKIPPIPADSDPDKVAKQNALKEYIKRYFVKVSNSFPVDYPFPGAGIQGSMTTFATVSPTGIPRYISFTMVDAGTNLTIRDGKNNTVNVTNIFPYIYYDGASYAIDGLLSRAGE